jgi:hypothetical protein
MLEELLAELVAAIVTVIVLSVGVLARPTHVRCPDGTDLRAGIRRDGYFECWPRPLGEPHWDPRARAWIDDGFQPGWRLGGRVYCTGGTEVLQDGQSAWCQPRTSRKDER